MPAVARVAVLVALLVTLGGLPVAAQAPAPAGTVLFPTDALTVADPAQRTGRRLALPAPDCATFVSECDEVALLNTLDGFDLDPRIVVQLEDPASAADPLAGPTSEELAATFGAGVLQVERADGHGEPIAVNRLVYDAATATLYGHPAQQLRESTAYRVRYAGGGQTATAEFTTLSASATLAAMRAQLDDGSAYTAAGIPADRRGIDFSVPGPDGAETTAVFPAANVATITRLNQDTVEGPLVEEMVLNSATLAAGSYAFGSFLSPSWLDGDRTIAATPTGDDGPAPTGFEEVGVTLILPAGTAPEGGWPVAIFGPGITRSKYDLFLAADGNAAAGIATLSLDPVGHARGPASEVAIRLLAPPSEVRISAFGRGADHDGDGLITDLESVSAPAAPHPRSAIALRDGLRQTAADVMALVRAVATGVDVDGDGTADLRPDGVSLYAQSLGGIYGTMVMGVDPLIEVGALNVPGGSIADIARQAPGFRPNVRDLLADRVPGLLNGGRQLFTEDLPLALDPPVADPAWGALAIQEVYARTNWINRSGSPEAFAPRIAADPLPGNPAKRVFYQLALGDQTVPNPASATLVRAFGDLAHVTLYRNDLTPTAAANPHGFLLDPRIPNGRSQGQVQIVDWLASDGETLTDPDGPAPVWETPIADLATIEVPNFDPALLGEPGPAPFERFAGGDRLRTAVEVSQRSFASATTVVVARADDYADALTGGPLAAQLDAPLLLVPQSGLPPEAAAEVQRLGATEAVLLGGLGAVAQGVEDDLTALGVQARRLAGPSRFATAAQVALAVAGQDPAAPAPLAEVILAEGAHADPARGWPDALSASGLGAALGLPVLLVERDRLPDETAALLGPETIVTVLGGPGAVSDAVLGQVDAASGPVVRVAGPDRYATSAAAATLAVERGADPVIVWVATGRAFADGLVAGATAGGQGHPLVLVDGADLDGSPATRDWLADRVGTISGVRGSGGTAAIAIAVAERLANLFEPGTAGEIEG